MLSDHPVYATIPTPDMARARQFYEDVLGFVARSETPAGIIYPAAGGTYFILTRSSGAASGSHTQMGFEVSNLEDEVIALPEHVDRRVGAAAARPGLVEPAARAEGVEGLLQAQQRVERA